MSERDLILLAIVLFAYYFHTAIYPHPTKWWIMLK